MEATRNLCAQIPVALHDRVRQERETLGQSLSEYVTQILKGGSAVQGSEGADRPEYYCQKADLRFLEDVNLKRPKSMSEFETLWYNGSSRRGIHYDSTRYHALNLHSVFSKGTIEFRMFNSTLHAGEVKSYIQLCLAISHQALIQQRAMRTRTQSENEKYTFRTWLLRLGLIGDEFKTARQHLLKNLEGNIAWKGPAQAVRQRERPAQAVRQRERLMQQRMEQAQASAVQPDTVQEVNQQQGETPAFSMEEQC